MKGLLCTGQVVKNIQAGIQTNDRRPMRVQPKYVGGDCSWNQDIEPGDVFIENGIVKVARESRGRNMAAAGILTEQIVQPPSQVGDVLYVRETWKYVGSSYTPGPAHNGKDPKRTQATVQYQADEEYQTIKNPTDTLEWPVYKKSYSREGWLPNIHMPKWAARIFLEVTDVRCERVQDISREDAVAEGIVHEVCHHGHKSVCTAGCWPEPEYKFRDLWKTLYPGSWERNDWVWVRTFKQIEKPKGN